MEFAKLPQHVAFIMDGNGRWAGIWPAPCSQAAGRRWGHPNPRGNQLFNTIGMPAQPFVWAPVAHGGGQ
jgi:hypothetical protein